MKTKLFLLLALFLVMVSGLLHADLAKPRKMPVQPGLERRVQLINGEDYPEFQFYLYVTERESRSELPELQLLEPGKWAAVGKSGEGFYVRAVKGEEFFDSNRLSGNVEYTLDRNGSYRLEKVKIKSFEEGVLKIEIRSRDMQDESGNEIEAPSKGSVGGLGIFPTLILPAVCLLGLVAFLVFRRKSARS
jgi:hypothetical protein